MSIEQIFCTRRDLMRWSLAAAGRALSEPASSKEMVLPLKAYGFLFRDLPAYQFGEGEVKTLLEAAYFPKGCLLRLNRFISDDGLLGKKWLGIKRDSWVHNPQAPLDQQNLIIPFEWKTIGLITSRNMQPISSLRDPSIYVAPEDKRIVIDLAEPQTLTAFEGDDPVLTCQVSCGLWDSTPRGEFGIFAKQPSRYMQGGENTIPYDLPGVPCVCYITPKGLALHGTYWHSDFGRPHSHGCINLPTDAAFLIFRWTNPVMNFDEEKTEGIGTKVIIR